MKGFGHGSNVLSVVWPGSVYGKPWDNLRADLQSGSLLALRPSVCETFVKLHSIRQGSHCCKNPGLNLETLQLVHCPLYVLQQLGED